MGCAWKTPFRCLTSARTATLPARDGVGAILAEVPGIVGRRNGHPPPRAWHAAREGRGEQVSRRAEGRTRCAGRTKAQVPMTNRKKAESGKPSWPSKSNWRAEVLVCPMWRPFRSVPAETPRRREVGNRCGFPPPRHRAAAGNLRVIAPAYRTACAVPLRYALASGRNAIG